LADSAKNPVLGTRVWAVVALGTRLPGPAIGHHRVGISSRSGVPPVYPRPSL